MRTLIKDTPQHQGKDVTLIGWVHARRDHGKLIFIDLRDRWGMVQVVFTPSDKELLAQANQLRSEWVIRLEGFVKQRPQGMQNPEMPTGTIEIEAKSLEIISEAQTPPFAIDTDGHEIGEEHRLEYRYLDLRRSRMQKNLILRDQVISFIRNFLHEKDFIEIETPILTKSTPEGARDYVVPSRIYPGTFYALPQSPQQYKQLLMVAGIERYFQIARCFRDEDTRGDRQPEHTQLDLEMSFVEREDILSLLEELMVAVIKEIAPERKINSLPFPRFSYKEVMETYNSDKPDLRENKDDNNELAFCWIIDFPMFEKDEKTNTWTYGHNPFSGIRADSVELLREKKDLEKIISNQYDLVLNGYELGSGSIRNHNVDLLKKVFEILGHSKQDIKENFGHMLDAFSFGVPPHGGMAWGLDRLIMLLAGEPNIREVIAFPKTGDARDLMMKSPAEIPAKHLDELGIKIIKG
ncbi:MAG: aspartate--tRNA ligase [Candidatus Sungbacteria bacterium]|nr:aspartate--tRNA ligase [bacterium]MDZ4260378.1 aspartate--tRNA ligase [Candidatus Sungbacteria bacterium]